MSAAKAYLQLLRLPNVITAVADILAGYLILGGDLTGRDAAPGLGRLAILAAASACLYMAGVVLNDYFDFAKDEAERPNRPLPSGRITRRQAGWVGTSLLIGGVALAQIVPGPTRLIAISLAACILLYDGVLKRTVAGPPCMGICRSLNLLLGMSAAGLAFTYTGFYAALVLGVYVASLTGFARREATGGSVRGLTLAAGGMIAALLAIGGLYWIDDRASWTVIMAAGVLVVLLAIPVRSALFRPSPQTVQSAVKKALLLLVFVDAGMVLGVGGLDPALLVAALWIPSRILARSIPMT